MIFLLGLISSVFGFSVKTPGDLTSENLVTADTIHLPVNSEVECDTLELNECIAESIEVASLTTDILTVDTIYANDQDLTFFGRMKVSGDTSYSFMQLDQGSSQPLASFLEISRNLHWREVGVVDASQVQLPSHKHIMLTTAVHFTDEFAEETLKLTVDGRIAWLETYLPAGHEGTWTSTIKTVLKHEGDVALIQFEASKGEGNTVDPLLVYVK